MKTTRIPKTLMMLGVFCGAMTFGLVQKTHASLMMSRFETIPAENSELNHNLAISGWSSADFIVYAYFPATRPAGDNSIGADAAFSYLIQDFTGWREQALIHIAINTAKVSSFPAVGNSNGHSSFSMNDSVALVAVPEPATLVGGVLMLIPFGVSALGILRRKVRA
jgi:hypothetical protein